MRAVNLLVIAGFVLAILYALVNLGEPSVSGAFTAAGGPGAAVFAVAIAVLAIAALLQGRVYRR